MSEFLFVADHAALDFLNTEKAHGAGERVELLTDPGQLSAWMTEAGFGAVAADEALLGEARRLRDAVRALVVAWTGGEPAPGDARAVLNAVLATGAARAVLTADFSGASETVTGGVHPLFPVAGAALDLLTRHERSLVRRCAGTGCVLWFLDTTKNKKRRWCRMEACGNREKVAAHYRRQRQTASETDATEAAPVAS